MAARERRTLALEILCALTSGANVLRELCRLERRARCAHASFTEGFCGLVRKRAHGRASCRPAPSGSGRLRRFRLDIPGRVTSSGDNGSSVAVSVFDSRENPGDPGARSGGSAAYGWCRIPPAPLRRARRGERDAVVWLPRFGIATGRHGEGHPARDGAVSLRAGLDGQCRTAGRACELWRGRHDQLVSWLHAATQCWRRDRDASGDGLVAGPRLRGLDLGSCAIDGQIAAHDVIGLGAGETRLRSSTSSRCPTRCTT